MVGERIGRYHIVEPLGEGGWAKVYRADDTLLGRTVAIKLLDPKLLESAAMRRRFLREAKATSSLEHPGIATLYDAGEADGQLYIVVAYVKGQTVAHMLANGALSVREAIRIAIDVADALHHAHQRGVIHRDVTARNIMVAHDHRVVVIDFGLALRPGSVSSSNTAVGTLAYMASEILAGEQADERTDVYGLGVVLYQMLTGALPFQAEQAAALIYAIMNLKPLAPSQRLPGLDRRLDRIVVKAMAKRREGRYRSASEFSDQLRAYLGVPSSDRDLRATPASPPKGRPSPPRDEGSSARTITVVRSVAVLPFQTMDPKGADPAAEAFARGLSESLSAALARVPRLRIVTPHQIPSAGVSSDTAAIARAVGVQRLLRAAVGRSRDRLRVSLSLLDRRGRQVAGDIVDGRIDDVFALEDALLAAVCRALRVGNVHRGAENPIRAASHERYLQALGYLQRTDDEPSIDAAIALLEELLTQEGDTALVHAKLGRAYARKWELSHDPVWRARAEAACRAALGLDPHSPDTLVTLAWVHLQAGRTDEALLALERSLELRRDNPDAWTALVRVHEHRADFAMARKAAEEAVRQWPDFWSVHDMLAFAAFRLGDYEQALTSWRKVLDLMPGNAHALNQIATTLIQTGRLEEARDHFEQVVMSAPSNQAYSGLGTTYFWLGDHEHAIGMFERATELAPRDPSTWGNLADVLQWVPGREREAVKSFDRAIGLAREKLRFDSKSARWWALLALWLAKRDQTTESLTAIRKALEIAPHHASCLAFAISVYHLAGDRGRALDCLRSALAAGYGRLELERDPELADLRRDPEARKMFAIGAPRAEAQSISSSGGRMIRKTTPIPVTITVINQNTKPTIQVVPDYVDEFYADGGKKDPNTLVWHSPHGKAKVCFKNGKTPFYYNKSNFDIAAGGSTDSGKAKPHKPRPDNRPEPYPYDVSVVFKGVKLGIDPQVDVSPGGPPEATAKKKDAKTATRTKSAARPRRPASSAPLKRTVKKK